ncbi:MAG: AEC family transporter [Alphaproteobacteria bacterium]|nr:AEC family transporter [Alphaproteobacteria bacterium]
MVDVLLSIAPVFALIVLGHVLRRLGFPSFEFWNINDRLVYWVLFPALLFSKTSTLSFAGDLVGDYAIVILGGFAAATIYGLAMGRALGLGGPAASSVLQGAARHNTFIALAVSERLFGGEGLGLAAVATSLLIPVTNIVIVSCMVGLIHAGGGRKFGAIFVRELLRNPLIAAVGLGVAVNVTAIGPIPILNDATAILGAAALPVMLLCVGASLHREGIRGSLLPFVATGFGKLLVFPLVIMGLALALGLHGTAAMVAMIYGAVPTASSGYTLARQMGGDAHLMASIITFQTAIGFVTMPLTILAAGLVFG